MCDMRRLRGGGAPVAECASGSCRGQKTKVAALSSFRHVLSTVRTSASPGAVGTTVAFAASNQERSFIMVGWQGRHGKGAWLAAEIHRQGNPCAWAGCRRR